MLEGYKLADFNSFDVVINTIPKEQDWDYEKFRGKRIIEVSSFPYGFDIEKLTDLGIRYEIISAIPSKYAPVSAANIMKKSIEKIL